MQYPDFSSWRLWLEEQARLPEGFSCSLTNLEFVPKEKPEAGSMGMNLALLRVDEPTDSFAGVFTKNAFPGWPVLVGRKLMDAPVLQGVVVNNKIANVGALGGQECSERIAAAAAAALGDKAPYLPSSTGVIGWELPEADMTAALPGLACDQNSSSILGFAEAIMTTDAWPKVRGLDCGDGRIVGTAKGAGMVEPNMATMLAFITTDLDVPRDSAQRILADVSSRTFNRISVDGETSTSDTVLLLCSGRKPYPGDDAFRDCLERCTADLAEDVVRNGEGCAHVFRVHISGTENESTAVDLARAVANAPLTKTALRGNDPNVGRIIQALGAACGRKGLSLDRNSLTLDIGGRRVYGDGRFLLDSAAEAELADYLTASELPLPAPGWPSHEKRIDIDINLRSGGESGWVIGSDLTEEYVKINGDYRT